MGEVAGQGGSGPGGTLARVRARIADDRRRLVDPVETIVSICADGQEITAALRPRAAHDPLLESLLDGLADVLGLADRLADEVLSLRALVHHDGVRPAHEPAAASVPAGPGGGAVPTTYPVE